MAEVGGSIPTRAYQPAIEGGPLRGGARRYPSTIANAAQTRPLASIHKRIALRVEIAPVLDGAVGLD